jgi:hypothetical protein
MLMIALILGTPFVVCGLAWFYGRILYPIPIRFEGASDFPDVDPRIDQRFRQFEGE